MFEELGEGSEPLDEVSQSQLSSQIVVRGHIKPIMDCVCFIQADVS
jgi:hypothetical protein